MKYTLQSALKKFAGAALLAVVGLSTANATLMLRISDPDNTDPAHVVQINDGDSDGYVDYISAFENFSFNIIAGISKPLVGTANQPIIDLLSLNVSGDPGTIKVELTDTDFFGPVSNAAAFFSSIGGTTGGKVTFATYVNADNTAFGTGQLLSEYNFDGSTAIAAPFSFGDTGFADTTSGKFSITLVTTVTHKTSGKHTSFDGAVSVPEPATLGILGLGLVGMLPFARKRTQRVA